MDNYNKAMVAIRAWKDGAASRAMNPDCINHSEREVRETYNEYYTVGKKASAENSKSVAEKFGVKFSIIKTQ